MVRTVTFIQPQTKRFSGKQMNNLCHYANLFLSLPLCLSLSIYIYANFANNNWLVVGPPLWKIWVRQLGWLATQYFWENKTWQPNHQPDQNYGTTQVYGRGAFTFSSGGLFFTGTLRFFYCVDGTIKTSGIKPLKGTVCGWETPIATWLPNRDMHTNHRRVRRILMGILGS